MFNEREPEKREIAPDLAAIERQLARMTPAAPRIDRDRLMFEAGRASVAQPERPGYVTAPFRLGRHIWPAATAMMTAASLLLAIMLFDQHQSLQLALNNQPAIVPIQTARQPPAAAPQIARPQLTSATWLAARAPRTGYLGTRFVALTRGVAALDNGDASGIGNGESSPAIFPTSKQILNELLPKSSRTDTPKS